MSSTRPTPKKELRIGTSTALSPALSSSPTQTKFSHPVLVTNMRQPNSITFTDALKRYGPAPGARALMDREENAARWSMETGIYGVYRCPLFIERRKEEILSESAPIPKLPPSSAPSQDLTPFPRPSLTSTRFDKWEKESQSVLLQRDPHFLDFCSRIGPACMCFCGHLFADHDQKPTLRKGASTKCHLCECKDYYFVPSRPEEVGDWHLPRRKDFDITTWRVKCRCGHPHDKHRPSRPRQCTLCGCSSWVPNYSCISCEHNANEHEVVWETREERIREGYPVDEGYLPLSSAPDIRHLAFHSPTKKSLPSVPKKALPSPTPAPKPGGFIKARGKGRITSDPSH